MGQLAYLDPNYRSRPARVFILKDQCARYRKLKPCPRLQLVGQAKVLFKHPICDNPLLKRIGKKFDPMMGVLNNLFGFFGVGRLVIDLFFKIAQIITQQDIVLTGLKTALHKPCLKARLWCHHEHIRGQTPF